MILEACVETFDEALKAAKAGSHRVELCSDLELDGLTPNAELISKTCSELGIPIMVMIRPRGGSFVYMEVEIREMEHEIAVAKMNGASGIVLGLMTAGGEIDVANTGRLAALASPLPVTFHKAIDTMEDPVEGVRQLLNIEGVTRILTSGGKPTAREGAGVILRMMEAAGERITILVAGKVTCENVGEIVALTGARELHGRRIVDLR